ncbi:MAG: hypothetical protein O2954_19185, partial [bacterium]|nr:hypothetical protein [bacterium]
AVCMQELQRVGKDVTQEELDRARTVLKGRLFTTGDLPEGRAGSLLEDMFLDGHVRSVEQIAQGVDSVRLEQISAYLEAFPLEPYTLVTLGPRTLKEE